MTETTPTLEMRDVCKRYGGVQALTDASIKIYSGEVHALVGDNAAGKSTLIKIMSGAVTRELGHDPVCRPGGPRRQSARGQDARHRDGLPGPGAGR